MLMDDIVLERERAREAQFRAVVGVGAAARAQAIRALPESLCGGELDGAAGAALKRGG